MGFLTPVKMMGWTVSVSWNAATDSTEVDVASPPPEVPGSLLFVKPALQLVRPDAPEQLPTFDPLMDDED